MSEAPSDPPPPLARGAFDVTAADVTAAQRAHLRWRMRRPQAWFYPLLFSFLAILVTAALRPDLDAASLLAPVLVIFGTTIVLVAITYAALPYTARRAIRRQPNLSQPWEVELSDAGIRATTPMQDTFIAWGNYVAWHEDRHVVLMYHSDHLFQFMPARSVTPAMREVFHHKVAGLPRR